MYEKVAEAIYKNFVDKSSASPGMLTTVNLGSGLIAGFAAAIISQPADTMLSKINKTKGLPGESTTSRLVKIAGELGVRGSFSGLGARLFMVGSLVMFCTWGLNLILIAFRLPVNSPSTATSSVFLVPLVVLKSPPRKLLMGDRIWSRVAEQWHYNLTFSIAWNAFTSTLTRHIEGSAGYRLYSIGLRLVSCMIGFPPRVSSKKHQRVLLPLSPILLTVCLPRDIVI